MWTPATRVTCSPKTGPRHIWESSHQREDTDAGPPVFGRQSSHLLPRAERGEQPSGVLGRAHGIRAQAFDRWRQQCSGMRVRAAQRWRALSHENARLKRRCAERDLEVDGLQAGLAKQS